LLNDLFESYRQIVLVELARLKDTKRPDDERKQALIVVEREAEMLDFLVKHCRPNQLSAHLLPQIPRWSEYRASLLTLIGETDEAVKEWDRALRYAAPGQAKQFESERLKLTDAKSK
jgi:hypothetical protein